MIKCPTRIRSREMTSDECRPEKTSRSFSIGGIVPTLFLQIYSIDKTTLRPENILTKIQTTGHAKLDCDALAFL